MRRDPGDWHPGEPEATEDPRSFRSLSFQVLGVNRSFGFAVTSNTFFSKCSGSTATAKRPCGPLKVLRELPKSRLRGLIAGLSAGVKRLNRAMRDVTASRARRNRGRSGDRGRALSGRSSSLAADAEGVPSRFVRTKLQHAEQPFGARDGTPLLPLLVAGRAAAEQTSHRLGRFSQRLAQPANGSGKIDFTEGKRLACELDAYRAPP
jgi:hypothetical protein